MQINTLNNILFLTFPEDIIRTISSYFIKKIPKDDKRYRVIENYLINQLLYSTIGLYPDGEFRYKIFQILGIQKRYFLLEVLPTIFIDYHFCIDDRITSIRFWFKDNKCEVPVNGRWVKK